MKLCVVLDYMYRDAANYKESPASLPVVCGDLPEGFSTGEEYRKALYDSLIDGEWFHPEDLGLPTSFIYEGGWSEYQEDLDHDLHEICDIRVMDADSGIPSDIAEDISTGFLCLEEELTPATLLEKMKESKKRRGKWMAVA